MADAATSLKNKAQEFGNTFGQAATTAAENVKSAAGNVADAAKKATSNIAAEGQQAANQAATYLGQRAGDATEAVGSRLKAAGDAIRHNVPQDGPLGQASSVVAQSLEDTGEYIQREGLNGIACDMSNMIKKNPISSLMVGVGLGFLLAHATKSRS